MLPGVKDPLDDLVDCKIKIWWPKDRVFYEGTVTSFDHLKKKHTVVYTDGEIEVLNLRKERWEFADEEETDADVNDPADDGHAEHQPTRAQTDSCNQNSPEISSTSRVTNACSELVDVNGYKVKAGAAPTLKSIFEKHGDIAENCLYKSASVKASLLEVVCDIFQRLHNHEVAANSSDMAAIVSEFSDVEAAKIDVSWLRSHFPSEFGEEFFLLKDAKAKALRSKAAAKKDFEQRLVDLMEAQENLKEADTVVKFSESEAQKFEGHIVEYVSEWKKQLGSNMEDGEPEVKESESSIKLAAKKRGTVDKKGTKAKPKKTRVRKI